ncbi:hypothetical protein QE152_g27029 [Popillia japonica]|uniref:Uncharacterized protein n=1 Tax=Popillia japonica TaxID=7064 RepID=A0AAW1JUW5_POPJA
MLIKTEKERYFHNIIDGNKHNSKGLWRNLITLIPDNNKKKQVEKSIPFHSELVEEDGNIAEKFNLYLIRSIRDIVDEVNIVNSHGYVLGNIETYGEWSSFREIDMYAKKLKRILKAEESIDEMGKQPVILFITRHVRLL